MERIELTSAEEIFSTPLEHPKMLIEGMLPTGLTVLNGDSKIGKSWMVLPNDLTQQCMYKWSFSANMKAGIWLIDIYLTQCPSIPPSRLVR